MNPDDLVFRNSRPAASRWARAGWALAALALVALGVLWQLERSRHWEAPRWDAAAFEVLLADSAADSARETWAVAFNPDCPHCRESLIATLALRAATTPPPRVAVLIVDTPARPDRVLAASLGADAVWWDVHQRWRRAWGHRVYGEVLCFDSAGAWLRTLPSPASGTSATPR
jgi:hypothetical protein